jgi:hypothetical protein
MLRIHRIIVQNNCPHVYITKAALANLLPTYTLIHHSNIKTDTAYNILEHTLLTTCVKRKLCFVMQGQENPKREYKLPTSSSGVFEKIVFIQLVKKVHYHVHKSPALNSKDIIIETDLKFFYSNEEWIVSLSSY